MLHIYIYVCIINIIIIVIIIFVDVIIIIIIMIVIFTNIINTIYYIIYIIHTSMYVYISMNQKKTANIISHIKQIGLGRGDVMIYIYIYGCDI